MPTVAFKAENIVPDGWDQDEFDYTPFTYPFNMTCHPAATINCGFSDGLPIGFQIIAKKDSDSTVLIVGAGPAGLEAARMLGQRGYRVMLAEATRTLGGRVTREAALPGLNEWIRVRDYRVQQIEKMLFGDLSCYKNFLQDLETKSLFIDTAENNLINKYQVAYQHAYDDNNFFPSRANYFHISAKKYI